MKKVIAPVLAMALVFATAATALAGKPDFYREQSSGSEYDGFASELCGFDVWITYRTDFYTPISGQSGSYFHAERTRTGPGGSLKEVVHLTFLYPEGFQIIGDPESGSWTEIIHEVALGSLVWSTPGDGVIYRVAGYAEATLVATFTPDGETFEVTDEVFRGQTPGILSEEERNNLLCETLG